MGETKGLGYADWDGVVKDCDLQFKKMEMARHNMELAEVVQKKIKSFAIGERRKYPEPATETMAEDENKPDEGESTEDKTE